jgi:hypothetical protein
LAHRRTGKAQHSEHETAREPQQASYCHRGVPLFSGMPAKLAKFANKNKDSWK